MDNGLLTAFVTGGFALMTSVAGYVLPKIHKASGALAENSTSLAAVTEQVTNGHATNLRDDIDKILETTQKLLEGQATHTSQIGDLRTDLEWERRERMDLARKVDGKYPLA